MILSYLIKILEWGRLGLNVTLLCTTPWQNALRNAWSKHSTSGLFGCVYKPIEKNKIPVVRGLKTKRKNLQVEQKVKKKNYLFWKFIHFSSFRLLHQGVFWFQVTTARQGEIVFTGFLACYWFHIVNFGGGDNWEKNSNTY